MLTTHPGRSIQLALCFALLEGCSGGGSDSASSNSPANLPGVPPAPTGLVSAASTFSTNCAGVLNPGTLYVNAEVEPQLAINPANPNNLVGTWQQDRWSNGASRGIAVGVSFDAGSTWATRALPVSRCGGGNVANGGDFERASDPWVTFSPNGVAYQLSLGVSGTEFQAGASSAMLVSRSSDGGRTWAHPLALIRDGAEFFNDKNTITADPTDSRYVYAVWDRLTTDNRGPTFFTRTIDGGASWEPAHAIFDPGVGSQTIGNIVAVLPDGTLVNFFTQLKSGGTVSTGNFAVIRSSDKGATWSQPTVVASFLGIGSRDPETGSAIRDSAFLGQISVGAQGQLYVVWQDARFSNGVRDAIAFTSSTDGGVSWSAPVRVNGDASVQGLIPSISARADGTIGVSYFDMRSNTADPATLPIDFWLATSRDGVNWTDQRIAPAFDLAAAPIARGYFLGDYMGLTSDGANFYPFYVRTNSGNPANQTDVYMTPVKLAKGAVSAAVAASAADVSVTPMAAEFQRRVHDNINQKIAQRVPGWMRAKALHATQPP